MLECLAKATEDAERTGEVDGGTAELLILFESFADGTHQGKEEAILFPRLLERAGGTDEAAIRQQLTDHENDRRLMLGMQSNLVRAMCQDDPLSLRKFIEMAHDYVRLHRQHMAREQEIVFPLADRVLTREDGQDVLESFERVQAEGADSAQRVRERVQGLWPPIRRGASEGTTRSARWSGRPEKLVGASMSELAFAAVWVAAIWLATSLAMLGMGLWVSRLFGRREIDGERVLMAFWWGLCATIALLQLWHALWPVSEWALGTLGALGAIGVLRDFGGLRRWTAGAVRRQPVSMLLAALASLWLAAAATGSCLFGDTGMYHLPMARWLVSHSIVPGLANLHGRFGFNNSSLLYAALFEVGPLAGRSHHLANGPLVLAFWAGIVLNARRWLTDGSGAATTRPAALFYLLLFVPAFHVAFSRQFTSLSTDLPAGLLLMVAGWRLCHVLSEPAPVSRRGRRHELAFVAAALATASTVKITSLPFAAMGLALVAWAAVTARPGPGRWRDVALPACLVLAILFPWSARGVVLSGYPVYPVDALPAPVEWRVPREQVRAEHAWALASSRNDRHVDPDGRWVADWLRGRAPGPLVGGPVIVALAGVAAYLGFGRRRRDASRPVAGLLRLALSGAAASVAWFVLGPNPRFGFAVLWMFAGCCAALCAQAFAARFASRAVRVVVLALSALGGATDVLYLTTDPKLAWRSRWLAIEPGQDGGLHPYKTTELVPYDTDHGLRLYVPAESNNAWGGPLPATPYPARNLRLRRVDDLASGFVVEGAWSPERWPQAGSDFRAAWRKRAEGE